MSIIRAEDVLAATYLTMGKIAPEHEGTELNVGGSIISTAIQEATGVSRQKLHALYNDLGDPGDVAEACRHTQARICCACASAPQNATEMIFAHLRQQS